jgi:RHS repeat-associated protein
MLSQLNAPGADRFYLYDGDNQRVAIVAYGGATSQTWHYELRDPTTQVVREVDATKSGSTVTYVWKKDYVRPAGRLLGASGASPGGETNVYFHADHLGTPRLVTGAAGRRLAVHTYWPFGHEAAGSDVDDETMKFTGHERDFSGDGNDLDYMHARHYSNVAGRFLSIDPVLDAKSALSNPQLWNRYAYVSDNPMFRTDPDGRIIQLTGSEDERRRALELIKQMLRTHDRQYVSYDKKTGIVTIDPHAKGSGFAWGRLNDLVNAKDTKGRDVTVQVSLGATMMVKDNPGPSPMHSESMYPDGGGAFVSPGKSASSEWEVHVDPRGSYLLQGEDGKNAEPMIIMAHELLGHAWSVLFKNDHSEFAAQSAEATVLSDLGKPILRWPDPKK